MEANRFENWAELKAIFGSVDYEREHHRLPEATGVDALRFLIAQHGVKQGDLSEIGSQGVVSAILAGKRELNLRQVRALAKRFGVSAATSFE